MTYKQIEASRELRLWIKTIIIPAIAGVLYLDYRYPSIKYTIKDKITGIFSKFKKENN